MEIKIPLEQLQYALGKLIPVVKMGADNVTAMVLIDATKEFVDFCGTDGATNIVVTLRGCEIIQPGKLLIRLKDIRGYISKFMTFKDGYGTSSFVIKADDTNAVFTAKTVFENKRASQRTLKLPVFSSVIFPTAKRLKDPQLILNSSILKEGIGKVLHCVNPTEIRTAMTGVYIEVHNDKIIFVGANGVKLVCAELPIVAEILKSAYIMRYSFASLLRAVLEADTQVFISFEGKEVYLECNDIYIAGSLLLNETYPDFRKALTSFDKTVVVPRYDLLDSLTALTPLLEPDDTNRVTLEFKDDEFILHTDKSRSVNKVDKPFEHSFIVDINGESLYSILNDFVGVDLTIGFVNDKKPLIFKSETDKHIALLSVIKRR